MALASVIERRTLLGKGPSDSRRSRGNEIFPRLFPTPWRKHAIASKNTIPNNSIWRNRAREEPGVHSPFRSGGRNSQRRVGPAAGNGRIADAHRHGDGCRSGRAADDGDQAATLNAAKTFKKEKDFGSVEAGKVADLAIIKAIR